MINFLGLGFIVGFSFVLFSLVLSSLYGKKDAISLRISTLVIGSLFIVFYLVPLQAAPIFRLTGIMFLAALIINNLLGCLQLMSAKLFDKELSQTKIKYAVRLIFAVAIVASIALNITASPLVISYTEFILKKVIFFGLGVLIALTLIWKPNKK